MPPRRSKPAATARPVALDSAVEALAHPTRRAIILVLYARGGAMPAGLIADRFKYSWPTITRHLGVLESAGLVSVQDEGRQRLYKLQTAPLEAVRDWLTAVCTPNPQPGAGKPGHWTNLPYGTMRNTIPPSSPS